MSNSAIELVVAEAGDQGIITDSGLFIRDPSKATVKALTTYVTEMTIDYEHRKERGYDLWISLREDFCDWDERLLSRVERLTMRKLRNVLFDRNVYTPKDGTPAYKHIANLLVQLWQELPAEIPLPRLAIPGNNMPASDSAASSLPKIATPLPKVITPLSETPPPIDSETAPTTATTSTATTSKVARFQT